MQTEVPTKKTMDQALPPAHPNIEKLSTIIEESEFEYELRAFFLLLSEPNF